MITLILHLKLLIFSVVEIVRALVAAKNIAIELFLDIESKQIILILIILNQTFYELYKMIRLTT